MCQRHYDEWRHKQGRPRGDAFKNSLKFQHGITPEQYRDLLSAQDAVCAICEQPCLSGKRLAVDHDHELGRIRGLLCGRCNTALGLLEDQEPRLLAALDYLRGSWWGADAVQRAITSFASYDC